MFETTTGNYKWAIFNSYVSLPEGMSYGGFLNCGGTMGDPKRTICSRGDDETHPGPANR